MLKRNYATTTAQIGKQPEFVINQPHFLQQVDWADVIDDYQKSVKEEKQWQRAEDFAKALQSGDEEAIGQAWAAADPKSYAERLDELKEARIKREQALADAEAEHNRAIALEQLKNNLGIKKDEAAYEKELALEKLKRDWGREDKSLERQQQLEDKSLERQYNREDAEAELQEFYTKKVFEKELDAQYAKKTAIPSGKANIAKEVQVYNMFKELYPDMPTDQLIELSKSYLSQAQQQKDTRTTEEKRYDFAKSKGYSDEEATEYAMKTGKFAPNQPKPAKTTEEIFAEEEAKTKGRETAKKDIIKADALKRLNVKRSLFEKNAEPLMKELETGDATGLGEAEYLLSSASRPFFGKWFKKYYEKASLNQQAVANINNLMGDMVRDAMATQNINSRQADTQWEQQRIFYDITPDMDETRLWKRIADFKEYIRQIESGNPYYTPEEKPQAKTGAKILSITEEK